MELVESHVVSLSLSRFFKIAGVGVGFSKMLESESVLKKWGVGVWSDCGVRVDFLNLNNLWDGVGILKKSSESTTLLNSQYSSSY